MRLVDSDDERLRGLAGTDRHQGVVARVEALAASHSLDDTLDAAEATASRRCVLVLDGVTDPHNLGACLRVADGAGAHAVIAPKDHAVGINATVAKVASGAAETVPYFMVTNLARTLGELKERDIRVVGTAEDAPRSLYDARPRAGRWRSSSAPKAAACASSRRAPATSWCTCRCAARSRASTSRSPAASACTRRRASACRAARRPRRRIGRRCR